MFKFVLFVLIIGNNQYVVSPSEDVFSKPKELEHVEHSLTEGITALRSYDIDKDSPVILLKGFLDVTCAVTRFIPGIGESLSSYIGIASGLLGIAVGEGDDEDDGNFFQKLSQLSEDMNIKFDMIEHKLNEMEKTITTQIESSYQLQRDLQCNNIFVKIETTLERISIKSEQINRYINIMKTEIMDQDKKKIDRIKIRTILQKMEIITLDKFSDFFYQNILQNLKLLVVNGCHRRNEMNDYKHTSEGDNSFNNYQSIKERIIKSYIISTQLHFKSYVLSSEYFMFWQLIYIASADPREIQTKGIKATTDEGIKYVHSLSKGILNNLIGSQYENQLKKAGIKLYSPLYYGCQYNEITIINELYNFDKNHLDSLILLLVHKKYKDIDHAETRDLYVQDTPSSQQKQQQLSISNVLLSSWFIDSIMETYKLQIYKLQTIKLLRKRIIFAESSYFHDSPKFNAKYTINNYQDKPNEFSRIPSNNQIFYNIDISMKLPIYNFCELIVSKLKAKQLSDIDKCVKDAKKNKKHINNNNRMQFIDFDSERIYIVGIKYINQHNVEMTKAMKDVIQNSQVYVYKYGKTSKSKYNENDITNGFAIANNEYHIIKYIPHTFIANIESNTNTNEEHLDKEQQKPQDQPVNLTANSNEQELKIRIESDAKSKQKQFVDDKRNSYTILTVNDDKFNNDNDQDSECSSTDNDEKKKKKMFQIIRQQQQTSSSQEIKKILPTDYKEDIINDKDSYTESGTNGTIVSMPLRDFFLTEEQYKDIYRVKERYNKKFIYMCYRYKIDEYIKEIFYRMQKDNVTSFEDAWYEGGIKHWPRYTGEGIMSFYINRFEVECVQWEKSVTRMNENEFKKQLQDIYTMKEPAIGGGDDR